MSFVWVGQVPAVSQQKQCQLSAVGAVVFFLREANPAACVEELSAVEHGELVFAGQALPFQYFLSRFCTPFPLCIRYQSEPRDCKQDQVDAYYACQ